jgi:arsenite methyltransferase
MQNRGMRQSLHRRYQDESRKVEIGDVDLATMSLEITSKERASAPQYGVDIFEPPGAGNFFVQDAVKLRIDAVSIDPGRNQLAYSDLDRARGDPEKRIAGNFRQFLRVSLDNGRDQCLLAGEVLVERADADAGRGRDLVGARPGVALFDQNASSRFDKRFDGGARSLLGGYLSGSFLLPAGHVPIPRMRVYIMSDRSYLVYMQSFKSTFKASNVGSAKVMSRAKYGVDAPGLVRAHLVLGFLLALIAAIGLAWPRPNPVPLSLSIGAAAVAVLLLTGAAVMLRSSLVSKKRVCDRMVAALGLSGNERVLDAGCGNGLALIRCAKKLTTGKAVGVDLWAAKDLSNNNPEATRANAAAEGVADRVEVETGDITKLPFSDASFDVVISMTVIHNIPSHEQRDQALSELVRVLKPGGRIAIFDLLHTARYAEALQAAGMKVQDLGYDLLWFLPCRSLLAQKPANP